MLNTRGSAIRGQKRMVLEERKTLVFVPLSSRNRLEHCLGFLRHHLEIGPRKSRSLLGEIAVKKKVKQNIDERQRANKQRANRI